MFEVRNMLTVSYINQKDISLIEDEWKRLERGSEMTYFQRFEWYKLLMQFTPNVPGITESLYAVVKRGRDIVLIAPLWVTKHTFLSVNKRGVYMIGRRGCTDYLNFIYSKFDESAVCVLLESLYARYGNINLYFENLKEETETFKYFSSKQNAHIVSSEICVSLSLPDSIEEYHKMLSKSTRQNLRTAVNRADKDGVFIEYRTDDSSIDKVQCSALRNERLISKKAIGSESLINRLKSCIYRLLEITFPPLIAHEHDSSCHFLSGYQKDELQMFFCYGQDVPHHQLVVMTAGLNEKTSRYSPGMVAWYNFILELIQNKEFFEIDFLKGGERYKYALGGKEHSIHNLIYQIHE